MGSDETLSLIHADVERAYALGLHYTPMIFINGVELRGWNATNALRRTVTQVAASSPAPASSGSDQPVLAAEKFVEDWEEQVVKRLPADSNELSFGPAAGAAAEVVVWGDYQETNTVSLDREVRAALAANPNIRYVFRHFPVDRDCNFTLPDELPPESVHDQACWGSQLVEAAGFLGGAQAHRRAHEWTMENQDALARNDVGAAARSLGLDADELTAEMTSDRVRRAIDNDCQMAGRMGVRAIPLVFVNGKNVPRTMRKGADVMTKILDRAVTEAAAGDRGTSAGSGEGGNGGAAGGGADTQ
jgi:protein-disulfide isomerase